MQMKMGECLQIFVFEIMTTVMLMEMVKNCSLVVAGKTQ